MLDTYISRQAKELITVYTSQTCVNVLRGNKQIVRVTIITSRVYGITRRRFDKSAASVPRTFERRCTWAERRFDERYCARARFTRRAGVNWPPFVTRSTVEKYDEEKA